jgi:hypothetical protein
LEGEAPAEPPPDGSPEARHREFLEAWYSKDVARYFHDAGAYDSEGIFMLDGSCLFVLDDEDSRLGYFGEHIRPLSLKERKQLPPARRNAAGSATRPGPTKARAPLPSV